jgi:hypothetical protein
MASEVAEYEREQDQRTKKACVRANEPRKRNQARSTGGS